MRTNAYTIVGDSGGPQFYEYKIFAITMAVKVDQSTSQPNKMRKYSICVPVKHFVSWVEETPELKALMDWKEPPPDPVQPNIDALLPPMDIEIIIPDDVKAKIKELEIKGKS
jgi:hypothetical protein